MNSYHGDIDPSLGAGIAGFVITHQAALAHQPAKGPLDHPTARQDFEAGDIIASFDDLHDQLGTERLDPFDEGLSTVTAVHP